MRTDTPRLRSQLTVCAGLCLALWLGTTSGAATAPCAFVVDSLGTGTHRTIQAAIADLPNPGPCTITVKTGAYHESVTVSGRNTLARDDTQRIDILAEPGALIAPRAAHAFVIGESAFITVQGFTLTGAGGAAILLDGSRSPASNITIAGNDIHNNGGAAALGGISIEGDSPHAWVVGNLVRSNRRAGIVVHAGPSPGGPVYIVNNTIFGNAWNGVSVGRGTEVSLINNLIVGNGLDRGTAGGRWGLVCERGGGPCVPGTITLRNNVFYRNGAGALEGAGGDIGNIAQIMDATDDDNYTTTGREGVGVSGCSIGGCAGAAFSAIFAGTGFGPDFRLAAGSPAALRGVVSFRRDGREWVPKVDVDGEVRGGDRIDVGYDQRAVVGAKVPKF